MVEIEISEFEYDYLISIATIIRHKPNGDCFYVLENGVEIAAIGNTGKRRYRLSGELFHPYGSIAQVPFFYSKQHWELLNLIVKKGKRVEENGVVYYELED